MNRAIAAAVLVLPTMVFVSGAAYDASKRFLLMTLGSDRTNSAVGQCTVTQPAFGDVRWH